MVDCRCERGASTHPPIAQVKNGEYIIETGEEADSLYVILSGEVVCHRGEQSGEELIRLTQGAVFGESSIDEGQPTRLVNVVAVTNVRPSPSTPTDSTSSSPPRWQGLTGQRCSTRSSKGRRAASSTTAWTIGRSLS